MPRLLCCVSAYVGKSLIVGEEDMRSHLYASSVKKCDNLKVISKSALRICMMLSPSFDIRVQIYGKNLQQYTKHCVKIILRISKI